MCYTAHIINHAKDCEMKPSHFTTPRTMADGTFATNADPIERPQHPTGYSTGWWACITILAVVATIVIAATSGAPL